MDGCRGNQYVTTSHVINSAIVKTSKLTRATKVYRGLCGGALPRSFLEANAQGVRGGIEDAFLSTTFDRDVAMQYATSRPGKPAVVFEIQMGMIDRGAELQWISQYPHERECLFAPLTGLEVQHTRVEGAALVVEVRLSINLNAMTIEQVRALGLFGSPVVFPLCHCALPTVRWPSAQRCPHQLAMISQRPPTELPTTPDPPSVLSRSSRL